MSGKIVDYLECKNKSPLMKKSRLALSPSNEKKSTKVKWVKVLTVVIFEGKGAFINIIHFLVGHK